MDISRCFSIHSSSPAIEFHSCFFFMTGVSAILHPSVDHSLTHFLGEFPGFGTGSCRANRCCSPRGGTEVRTKQKSRLKYLPWPGFEPRTLQSAGRERYH